MEHTTDHHVTEENMHPDYHERETRFRDQAATLWDKESNARAQIRTDVSLSEEERLTSVRICARAFDSLSHSFAAWSRKRVSLSA